MTPNDICATATSINRPSGLNDLNNEPSEVKYLGFPFSLSELHKREAKSFFKYLQTRSTCPLTQAHFDNHDLHD